MAKINHSATLEIGGKVSGAWGTAVATITGDTKKITDKVAGLKAEQRGVAKSLRETEQAAAAFGVAGSKAVSDLAIKHKGLIGQQKAVEAELAKAQRAAAKLGKQGSADVDRLLKESQKLEAEERDVAKQLEHARKEAEKFGISGSKEVAKLRGEHEKLGSVLDKEQYRLKRVKALHEINAGGRISGAIRKVGANLVELGRTALYAGTAIGVTAAAGIGWFTKSALEATASMEQMETALTVLEGSPEKARAATEWISNFAAKTPYELGQVSEAFIKMRSYGIDPTDGSLRTLGDTASAMGKDPLQAVEALADALTGENERLKEFGIKASTAGNKITYTYRTLAGKDVQKTVKKNATEIQKALLGIFDEKFAGGMEAQSKTWNGLISNLSDSWTQFQVRVMKSGVFDSLKGELEGLLGQVAVWAEDGTLERWADEIAGAYKWAFGQVREGFGWVRDHWPELKQGFSEFWQTSKDVGAGLLTVGKHLVDIGKWASDAMGGPKNLAMVLAGIGAAKVLSPLASVVPVLIDIAGWLLKSNAASAALSASMSGIGAAGKGIGGLLAKAAPMAGAVAGTAAGVLASGAAGYYGTKAVLSATGGDKKLEQAGANLGKSEGFNRFVEGFGNLIGSDTLVEAARGNAARNAFDASATKPKPVTNVQHTDHSQIHINVDAKDANADEVAQKVEQKLRDAWRSKELASYG